MGIRVRFSPWTFFLAALYLLFLPPRWLLGALFAAAVHETLHCLTVWLLGGQVLAVTVNGFGASMEASPMSRGREVLCVLAGPAGSLCVAFLGQIFPEAAICALLQGSYNLLPIFPLDGGRIVKRLLPEAVCRGIETCFLTFLSGSALWISTFLPEMAGILLLATWMPVIQRKFSCKEPKLAVQ